MAGLLCKACDLTGLWPSIRVRAGPCAGAWRELSLRFALRFRSGMPPQPSAGLKGMVVVAGVSSLRYHVQPFAAVYFSTAAPALFPFGGLA